MALALGLSSYGVFFYHELARDVQATVWRSGAQDGLLSDDVVMLQRRLSWLGYQATPGGTFDQDTGAR